MSVYLGYMVPLPLCTKHVFGYGCAVYVLITTCLRNLVEDMELQYLPHKNGKCEFFLNFGAKCWDWMFGRWEAWVGSRNSCIVKSNHDWSSKWTGILQQIPATANLNILFGEWPNYSVKHNWWKLFVPQCDVPVTQGGILLVVTWESRWCGLWHLFLKSLQCCLGKYNGYWTV